jgi:hypothetical protein
MVPQTRGAAVFGGGRYPLNADPVVSGLIDAASDLYTLVGHGQHLLGGQ